MARGPVLDRIEMMHNDRESLE